MSPFDFVRHLPVKRKLTLIVLSSCSVILLLACAGMFAFHLVLLRKAFVRDLDALAKVVADNCAGAVSFGDKRVAKEILAALTAHPHVLSARIELADGRELARSTENAGHEKDTDLLVSKPVIFNHERLGTLYMRTELSVMHRDMLVLYAVMLVTVLSCSFGIAVLLSSRLQRFITDPIFKLSETARIVAEKRDYSVRAENLGRDELGLLTDAFNQMLAQIESQDAELRSSELKFRQLAENIQEVFWMTTPDLKEMIYVSPAYQEVWGRSVQSLLQNPSEWSAAIVPEERQRVFETFRELESHRQSAEAEYRIQRPDGTIRWIHAHGFQVLNDRGQVCRLAGTATDITERKRAEAELEQMHKQLQETSRHAGMAEVATGVLHNVGNVLNSVNVSATLVADKVKTSRGAKLAIVVTMLRDHERDLGAFITSDAKGSQIPAFLATLAEHLDGERAGLLKELEHLQKNVEHIKDIVSMQQTYAKVSGVSEVVKVSELVEDALRMNGGSLDRHHILAVREFEEVPPITVDKHKVLQILVNLIRNAKHACDDAGSSDKWLKVRVASGEGRVKIAIVDNGVGIPPENITRIFNHGFTTRKNGHGFGLHSGALAAMEMGGSLSVHSDGLGHGATFTVELPLEPPKKFGS
jgi:PAS domain S-box-containing protein